MCIFCKFRSYLSGYPDKMPLEKKTPDNTPQIKLHGIKRHRTMPRDEMLPGKHVMGQNATQNYAKG